MKPLLDPSRHCPMCNGANTNRIFEDKDKNTKTVIRNYNCLDCDSDWIVDGIETTIVNKDGTFKQGR